MGALDLVWLVCAWLVLAGLVVLVLLALVGGLCTGVSVYRCVCVWCFVAALPGVSGSVSVLAELVSLCRVEVAGLVVGGSCLLMLGVEVWQVLVVLVVLGLCLVEFCFWFVLSEWVILWHLFEGWYVGIGVGGFSVD